MSTDRIFKKQKGVIILLFILLLPLLCAFIGLAIDMGYIYAEKTKLQNVVDASALAGVVHLKDTDTNIEVRQYVEATLIGNRFTPVGDDPTEELSAEQNWKLNYIEVTKDSTGKEISREVDTPNEANRLRVTVQRSINLTFIPIVARNLASVTLTSTAVAKGSMEIFTSDFQIMTRGKLILGECVEGAVNKEASGDVHIPVYPVTTEDLKNNIYAEEFDFKDLSTLLMAGKLVSDAARPAALTLTNPANHLPTSTSVEGCTVGDISNEFIKHYNAGFDIYMEATRKNNPIKAILIDLYDPNNADKKDFSYSDYNMLSLRDGKNSKYAGDKDYFDGLEVKAPVIFYNSGFTKEVNAKGETIEIPIKFTISSNISYFHFTKPIIVINGNLSISGSLTPANAPKDPFGVSKLTDTSHTTFSNVYCYATTSRSAAPPSRMGDKNAASGRFIIAGGAAAPKNFEGVIYADAGIRINACKNERIHIFNKLIISAGDIIFGADHYSTRLVPVSYKFNTINVDTQISLVE